MGTEGFVPAASLAGLGSAPNPPHPPLPCRCQGCAHPPTHLAAARAGLKVHKDPKRAPGELRVSHGPGEGEPGMGELRPRFQGEFGQREPPRLSLSSHLSSVPGRAGRQLYVIPRWCLYKETFQGLEEGSWFLTDPGNCGSSRIPASLLLHTPAALCSGLVLTLGAGRTRRSQHFLGCFPRALPHPVLGDSRRDPSAAPRASRGWWQPWK